MAFIDVEVRWRHGLSITDITQSVVSYTREQNICTGIGTLNVTVDSAAPYDFTVWDRIVLFESGHRRGTYYIAEDVRTIANGSRQLACQDASKKLTDYFIVESYYIDYATYTRTWIEKFLTEAGVDYQFETASSGVLVSFNSQLGKSSAYDTIQTLLQQSGWYMYVDNDNKFHIGNINKNLSNPEWTLRASQILSINTNQNDKHLRNRAVVWGESNGDAWVYADLSVHTPWDHGSKDQRTVVLSNGNIHSSSVAYDLAQKLLDEFAQLDYTKEIETPGYHRAEIGDVGRIRTKYWSGVGLVTTVGSSLSSSGLKTRIVLDQKCPRLFGYFGFYDYVYIGTNGAGVWRKELGASQWEAFTYGLENFDVTDLMIKGGVFACTAGGSAYINTNSTTAEWTKYNAEAFTEVQESGAIAYSPSEVEAVACDIDENTHNIYFGYRFTTAAYNYYGYYRSWVDVVDTEGNKINQYFLHMDLEKTWFKLMDVDKYGGSVVPTAEAPSDYCPINLLLGTRRSYEEKVPSLSANTYGPFPSETPYEDAIFYVNNENGGNSDLHIEGYSVTAAWNLSIFTPNSNTFEFFTFDKDDNIFKAIKSYRAPIDYFTDVYGDGLKLVHRCLLRSSAESGETASDYDTRPYTIVDIVRYTTNYGSKLYLYLYTYNVTPLIALPHYHDPVNAATTGNLYSLAGALTIDGVMTTPGMRVLVKDQTDPKENGIYVVSNLSWTRAYDADESSELIRGLYVYVLDGIENKYKAFQLDIPEDVPTIIGTTEFVFTEVFIVTGGGSQLILDGPANFSSVSASNFPKEVMMVEGTIYIWMTGEKTEGGIEGIYHDSYMGVYGDGGLSVSRYDRIEQRFEGQDPYPLVSVGNEILVGCGTGVAACRTISYVDNSGYSTHTSNVTLDVYKFEGSDVENSSLILVANTDAGKGDWLETGSPIHSAGVGIAGIVWVGSNLDNKIVPYLKFKASAQAYGMYQCCFTGDCGGPLSVAFDRSDLFATGIIDLKAVDFVSRYEYERGTHGSTCTEIGFDGWNYDKVNFSFGNITPTTCRGQYPKFIYQGNQIWDSVLDIQVGTLENAGNIAAHLDDFDGCFYIGGPTGTVYKEAPTGGTVAEFT